MSRLTRAIGPAALLVLLVLLGGPVLRSAPDSSGPPTLAAGVGTASVLARPSTAPVVVAVSPSSNAVTATQPAAAAAPISAGPGVGTTVDRVPVYPAPSPREAVAAPATSAPPPAPPAIRVQPQSPPAQPQSPVPSPQATSTPA